MSKATVVVNEFVGMETGWTHEECVQYIQAAQEACNLYAMGPKFNEALEEDCLLRAGVNLDGIPSDILHLGNWTPSEVPDPLLVLTSEVEGFLFSILGPARYKAFKANHESDFVEAAMAELELRAGSDPKYLSLEACYLEIVAKPDQVALTRQVREAEAMAEQEFEANHWVHVAEEQQREAAYDGPQVKRAKAIAKFIEAVDSDTIKAGNWMPATEEEPVEQYVEEQFVALKTAANVYAEYSDVELKQACRDLGIKGFSKGTKANRAYRIAEHFGLELNLMVPGDVIVEPVDEVTEEVVVSPEFEEAKANWAQALKAYNKAEDDGEDTEELAIISHGWFHRYGALEAKAAGDNEKAQEHIDAHRALRAEYKALKAESMTDRDVEAAVVDHHLEGEAEKVGERMLQDAAHKHVAAQMYRNDQGELVVRVYKARIHLSNIGLDIEGFVHHAYLRVEKWVNKGWNFDIRTI